MNKNTLTPYNIAIEIDGHFGKTGAGAFSSEEFFDIHDALRAVGNEKSQRETAELFKTLPKEEVIRRTKIISKLDSILKNVHNRRHDIQST